MIQDLSFLLSFKSMIVFLLVMSRVSGMLATAPLFSTYPIPMQVKVLLAALVAFIMYPFVLQTSHFSLPNDVITMSVMVFKEVAIGVLIGFCAGLIFTGIEIGGQLLSIQMGLTMADAIDPVTHQSVPIIGQFYLFIASIVFIYLNGHQWLFTSVYDSYNALPIGLNFAFSSLITERILFFTGKLFAIAFGIIMPIFGMLFIIDVALAFMSKVMPQMNIFMVGAPIKIYAGLGLMALFITTTASYMSGLITSLLDSIRSIFS